MYTFDNGTAKFNWELYFKVRDARIKQCRSMPQGNGNIPNHRLVGKQMLRLGKVYNIVSVHKHWFFGWYLAVLLECNNSHVLIAWENINCHNECIRNQIDSTRKSCYILA